MDFNDLMEILNRGNFIAFGGDMARGALTETMENRNALALICLHGLLGGYAGHDVPHSVDLAFRFADAFTKKAKEPAVKAQELSDIYGGLPEEEEKKDGA